jgi:hypothetical protein
LRDSAVAYSFHVKVDEHGEVVFVQATGTGDEQLLDRASRQRPRQQMTDERLREVARIYSEAESKPTLAVMRRFDLSRPTAGRWVGLARKRFPDEMPPLGKASRQ